MIWWRVSPQCIILAIEVLVTNVEGVGMDMSNVEGLLTILCSVCELQYRQLLLTVDYYCLLHIMVDGCGGSYCSLL